GNEVRFYDEVWGGKNVYANLSNWNLWDLWAVGYVLLPDSQAMPGFHRVMGPVGTTPGSVVHLFERDTMPAYARVIAAAAKIPEDRIIPTVLDPRFPLAIATLFPESSSVVPPPFEAGSAPPAAIRPTVTDWAPGRITVSLDGTEPRATYLVLAETWYPAWQASVDGAVASTYRANHAQLA